MKKIFMTNGSGNTYYCDTQACEVGLQHPLMPLISQVFGKHGTQQECIDEVLALCKEKSLTTISADDVLYYLKKYQWQNEVKKNSSVQQYSYDMRLAPNDVSLQLANLSQLTFEVTDACNLKCKYCGYGEFYSDYDERNSAMLPVEKAKRLIDCLCSLWNSPKNISRKGQTFISFYGGEPLMNMRFIEEVVCYTSSLNCNRTFTYSMTTNGLLLHKYMPFLVEHSFHLLISLDGNEHNNAYRTDHSGKGSFDKVTRNVELLQQTYPEYFKTHVNFNSVLHNKNSVRTILET